jgi:hypothetical protein
MRHSAQNKQIAKKQYNQLGYLQPKLLLRAGTQLGIMILFTIILLIQLDSDAGYSALRVMGSTYLPHSSVFTTEPMEEESVPNTTSQGRDNRSQPLFGFIPIYVAVLSLVILFVVFGGNIILYLYGTGKLR